MSYFTIINDLPIYDLKSELNTMLDEGLIKWHSTNNQISLNSVAGSEENFHLGCGSLYYDWDNQTVITDAHGNTKFEVKKRNVLLTETDFTVLCTPFKNTLFEKAYNAIKEKFNIGRVRLMRSHPNSCLSWHYDDSRRLHYPIKTQDGCFMVIKDEVKHLKENQWCFTDTLVEHTAFNASKEIRIHLVVNIIQ